MVDIDLNVDKHSTQLIEATGGIRIGHGVMNALNASWPCAHVTLGSENVSIRLQYVPGFIVKMSNMMYETDLRTTRLPYRQIQRYRVFSGILPGPFKGLRLIHTNEDIPPYIVIWLTRKSIGKVCALLNAQGIEEGR